MPGLPINDVVEYDSWAPMLEPLVARRVAEGKAVRPDPTLGQICPANNDWIAPYYTVEPCTMTVFVNRKRDRARLLICPTTGVLSTSMISFKKLSPELALSLYLEAMLYDHPLILKKLRRMTWEERVEVLKAAGKSYEGA